MLRNQNKKSLTSDLPTPKKSAGFKAKIFALALFVAAASYAVFIVHQNKQKVSSASVSVPTADANEIPGWWYQQYFKSSVCGDDNCKPSADPDKDGLTNSQEYFYHSDPQVVDTNKNGSSDGDDVAHNIDPSKTGNISFDQAGSDDEVLGESLVLNQDIGTMLNQAVDPNNVKLNLVPDAALDISQDNSKAAISTYVTESNKAVAKYFPSGIDQYITNVMKSNDSTQISDLQSRFGKSKLELMKVAVPSEMVTMQKYMIALLDVLPSVLVVPQSSSVSGTDVAENAWYDKTQQAMVLYQKISLETNRVKNIYQ